MSKIRQPLTLFGGASRSTGQVLAEAEGLEDLLGEDEQPQYDLSHKSKRLRDLTPAMRELNSWFNNTMGLCEQQGSLVQQARAFRTLSLVLGTVLLILAPTCAWLAVRVSEVRVVPYAFQVDRHNVVLPLGPGERQLFGSPRHVTAAVGRWIKAFREVEGDTTLQEARIAEAFRFVGGKSVASQKMNEWYERNPAIDGTGRRVLVELVRVAPLSSRSEVSVEWTEQTIDARGQPAGNGVFSAVVSVVTGETTRLEDALANPSGVFIRDFSMTKVQ